MSRSDTAPQPPVAIVGMGVLMPGAPDLGAYWHNLLGGVDSITEVPGSRWDAAFYRPGSAGELAQADQVYCRRGGFVDSFAEVDVARWGVMPSSVEGAEPDQLLALGVAAAAVDDAGGDQRMPERDRVAVVLGRGGYLTPGLARLDQRVRTANQLVTTLAELVPELDEQRLDRIKSAFTDRIGPQRSAEAIGLVPNLAASRIAQRLDLRGPAYTVDAACASSLIAVRHAVDELESGRCDAVLAGGVHHCHDITLWSVFSQLRALSASERIRPFHRDADGILIGEGTGIVVLKRLADAERDGDRVYAVIRGTGVSGDGRSASLLHPDPGGQVRALRQAWHGAGLDPTEPGSIGLLEAHGTATPAGDGAELDTVREVFGGPLGGQRPVLGSVKSMIGHTMPAAGVAGLVKAALAVHHGVLLPTLHCEDPHPELARTRFRTVSTAEPWEAAGSRRAAVNAFGFGGINAHVVLEQHGSAPAPKAANTVTEPERVLRLSARSPEELARCLDLPDTDVLAAENTAESGSRLGIVDPTAKRLALARKVTAKGVPWRGRNDVWFSPHPLLSGGGGIGFLFPGLEADFAPRVEDLVRHFGLSGHTLAAGSLAQHGTSVLRIGLLLDTALRRIGIAPDAVAGHSVGEWTALIAGGVHDATEVDRLLRRHDPDVLRVPGVAFAVLGCGVELVAEAIAELPDVVVSHENSTNQTIVCGPQPAIDGLVRDFQAGGLVCQVLPFRSGFHTPMLEPYLGPFRSGVDSLGAYPQRVPVWSATTVAIYPPRAQEVRDLYIRHLLEPVRFRALVEAMHDAGIRAFVQAGPGQLNSLIGDTLRKREHLVVAANSAHRDGIGQLRRVATAVWSEGGEPDFAALEPSAPARRAPVRLDLSSSLVSLRDRAGELGVGTAPPRETTAGLSALAAKSPAAAQLSALLKETATSAIDVIEAAQHSAVPVSRSSSQVLRVSTETMPYLLDHCFAPQREGWPDESDRRPVVPATTVLRHIMDAAEQAAPGSRAVEVSDLRLSRWLVASPAVQVTVEVTPERPDRFRVRVGDYAEASVRVSREYPAADAVSWPPEAETRWPSLTAAQFYDQRWMFHGPRFQGLTELTGVGARHATAVITAPLAPGAVLDNVGQLFGLWITEFERMRRVVFPVRIGRVRFFGTEPEPGARLECVLRIRSVNDTKFAFDAQVTVLGRVWAEITGWHNHRFDGDQRIEPAYHFPERHTLSETRPGGWALLAEWWRDLPSRELYLHKHLNSRERDEYERCAPQRRRHWLLGRIAVKDAVRQWLWHQGNGPVFPAEVLVENESGEEAAGRPTVTGLHGLDLTPLDVSLAHAGELGVALVRPTCGGVGIDVEEVTGRPASTIEFAFTEHEVTLVHRMRAASGESEERWFTRFWCAKEAVAKAIGTGMRGGPRRFVVMDAGHNSLQVEARSEHRPSRRFQVSCEDVANPEGLPPRQYVVAWTTADDEAQEEIE